LCEAGRLADDALRDPERALHFYERAAAEAPAALEPLQRLEALYSRTGRSQALEQNLKRQLELAVTPRQHIEITVKLATFKERELLDGQAAASLLEDALVIEPESRDLRRELIRLHERLGHGSRVLALWEAELERAPHDETALRATAELATQNGDDERAIGALEVLASLTQKAAERVEIWLDVAGRLEARAELVAARERYERVLESEPRHPAAWAGLRRVALALGDSSRALHVLDSELSFAKSLPRRADLYAERARVYLFHAKETERAEAAARHALELDESCAQAHVMLAECARAADHLADARLHYARALEQRDHLLPQELGRVLAHQAEVLSRLGEAGEALAAAAQCAELPGADADAILGAAEVMRRHSAYERALALCQALLDDSRLDARQRANALCCFAEAQAGLGDVPAALHTLRTAAAATPAETRALEALASLHRGRENFAQLVETLEAWADRLKDERRWDLLSEAGEIAAERLQDSERARRLYLAVLSEHPHHHRVLVDLLRLHGDAERWEEVVPVILALAESRQEPAHRVPHLLTAARIVDEKLNRPKEALVHLRKALALEADNPLVVERMLRLARRTSDIALSEELYPKQIEIALAGGLKPRALKLTEEFYQLVSRQDDPRRAIELCQSAHELDPNNNLYAERLSKLYAARPELHFDAALRLQHERLAHDPTRPEPYQALLDLYWSLKLWDGVWCAAQALVLLRRASPRVEALYRRYHPRTPARLTVPLSPADWTELIQHPDADGAVTEVFAVIEPALRRARGADLKKLGIKPEMRLDPAANDHGVVAALRALAPIVGAPLPALFMSKNQKRAIGLVRGNEPLLLLGPTALDELPELQIAFTVASHLTYFRPGYGLRHLLPTARALKASLLAAFKLCEPDLEIPAEFHEAVGEALPILDEGLTAPERERLHEVITGLLAQDQLVNLHQWLSGVDLTSDRLGLILCNDLTTALQFVRSADDRSSSVTRAERCKALFRYAVHPSYLELRARLALALNLGSNEPLVQRAG
jgi:tetratricopeptide (TPR) repeat protein